MRVRSAPLSRHAMDSKGEINEEASTAESSASERTTAQLEWCRGGERWRACSARTALLRRSHEAWELRVKLLRPSELRRLAATRLSLRYPGGSRSMWRGCGWPWLPLQPSPCWAACTAWPGPLSPRGQPSLPTYSRSVSHTPRNATPKLSIPRLSSLGLSHSLCG